MGSQMRHPLFSIPELVCLVCHAVVETESSGHASLAALARTCQFMAEPALDVLWSDLDDFLPLLLCLPSDLLRTMQIWNPVPAETSDDEEDAGPSHCTVQVIALERPIVLSDLARFIIHASRVRKLCVPDVDGMVEPIIQQNVLQAIAMATIHMGTLFPNLGELRWEKSFRDPESGHFLFSCVDLFLGPKITKLHFEVGSRADEAGLSILPTISNMYPRLTHFTWVSGLGGLPMNLSSISLAVCQLYDLQYLRTDNLNQEALQHLATLPALKELTLERFGSDTSATYVTTSPSVHHSSETGFCALRTLEITASGMGCTLFIIKLMVLSPLEYLDIAFAYHSPPQVWRTFLETVNRHCSHTTLRKCYLTELEDEVFEVALVSPNDTNSDIGLEYLTVFSNLKKVMIHPIYRFFIPMEAIAKAWTHLTMLDLARDLVSSGQPSNTCGDLIAIAEHCPHLVFFKIVFNATGCIPTVPDLAGGYSLGILSVVDSPIELAPTEVAAFLLNLFPNLVVIKTCFKSSLADVFRARWDETIREFKRLKALSESELEC